jgi:hypothetical protein
VSTAVRRPWALRAQEIYLTTNHERQEYVGCENLAKGKLPKVNPMKQRMTENN